ncbi:MAG: hypothetical protein ABIB98_01925, partial [bacterium]
MKYKILGNKPLSGKVSVSGSQDASLKVLASSIISEGNLEIFNVPKTGDVLGFIEILKGMGVSADFRNDGCLELNSINLKSFKIPASSKNICSSIILIGPLLARFGKAEIIKNPKYDWEYYFSVLKNLNVKITDTGKTFKFENLSYRACNMNFLNGDFLGTDLAILFLVLAEGTSILTNAAEDPEIDELITVLNKRGAKIKRSEQNSRTIEIEGVRSLGDVEHTMMPDRKEPVFYAVATIFTKGDIIMDNLNSVHLTSFLSKLSFMEINYEVISQKEMRVWSNPDTNINPVNIEVKPYPGFMKDWGIFFSVLLTCAMGESVITGVGIKLNGREFSKELNRMGAKIETGDSFIKIFGPSKLKGATVEALDAVSGMGLILAGLGAKGKTEV